MGGGGRGATFFSIYDIQHSSVPSSLIKVRSKLKMCNIHQWGVSVVVCVCDLICFVFMSEVNTHACLCVQGLYAMSMNCMEAAEAQFKTALEANKVPLHCPQFCFYLYRVHVSTSLLFCIVFEKQTSIFPVCVDRLNSFQPSFLRRKKCMKKEF